MAKKRIVILGGGVAGLSVAWHLKKRKHECILFEKEPQVGGLCRSKNAAGFTFDLSGHLLHFRNNYTLKLVKYLLKGNLAKHEREAFIYSFGRFTQYPFQAKLYELPPQIAKECFLGYLKIAKNPAHERKKDMNFLQWIQCNFGEGIAKYFMVPYNRKFWTVPLQQLTCEWLEGFIPVPTLPQVMEGMIRKSRRKFGYNARFWYPKNGGIIQLPLAFAGEIKNVYTNCPITEIDLKRKTITVSSGEKEKFDILISTIPLPELPRIISSLPKQILRFFDQLRWNSVFNLNLGIDKQGLMAKRHWIYFPDKDISFFRIGFPHNYSFSVTPPNKSSIYTEVSYPQGSILRPKNTVSSIKDDLERVGIIAAKDRICIEDINDIKYAYAIYDSNYKAARHNIFQFLAQQGIICCGRYGSWRYMSMEDAILDGREKATECLKRI